VGLLLLAWDDAPSAVELGARINASPILARDPGCVADEVDNVRGAVRNGFSPEPTKTEPAKPPANQAQVEQAERAGKSKAVAAEEVGRLLTHTGDETALKVLAIARDQNKTADERMQALAALDRRYRGYDSPKWADLLQVTPAAVRQTSFWKTRKQRHEWGA
jgi:hypothetical protein